MGRYLRGKGHLNAASFRATRPLENALPLSSADPAISHLHPNQVPSMQNEVKACEILKCSLLQTPLVGEKVN